MSLFPILFAAVTSACATGARSASVSECDVGIALQATHPDLNDHEIALLFETANESCSTETAFIQVFNEALFNALDTRPQAFLHYFSINPNRPFILDQLANPLHDSIDIARIFEQLRRLTPPNQAAYDEIMNVLRSLLRRPASGSPVE